MDLSKREKGLAFGSFAIVSMLLLDQYALTPLLDRQDALQAQREQILTDIQRAQKLFKERKQLAPKWNDILSTGLKHDPSEAESQLLHALRDWAKDAGFTLTSIKPDRPESKAELKEVQIQASGVAPMDGIVKFLWQLQSGAFPLKITELQLGSRDENTDLTLQMKVSTLYYVPEHKAAKAEKSDKVGAQ